MIAILCDQCSKQNFWYSIRDARDTQNKARAKERTTR